MTSHPTGTRVFLRFSDPDGERGPYGAPFGAFAGTIQAPYEGPRGESGSIIRLDKSLVLHREGSEIKGNLVGVISIPEYSMSPARTGVVMGDATLIRSTKLPQVVSTKLLQDDALKSAPEREFTYIGHVDVSVSVK